MRPTWLSFPARSSWTIKIFMCTKCRYSSTKVLAYIFQRNVCEVWEALNIGANLKNWNVRRAWNKMTTTTALKNELRKSSQLQICHVWVDSLFWFTNHNTLLTACSVLSWTFNPFFDQQDSGLEVWQSFESEHIWPKHFHPSNTQCQCDILL